MDRKEVKAFAKLESHVKTSAILALYQTMPPSLLLRRFTIKDVEIAPDSSLSLNVAEGGNSENDTLHDFAAVVYSLATGKIDSESMAWDAGRKIKEPVLREIVLTICGRNSLRPLLRKMSKTYVDEDTFFDGYTTVDEKEATESYKKKLKIDEAKRAEEAYWQRQKEWKESPAGKQHAAYMKSMERRYDPLAPVRKVAWCVLGACFFFSIIFSIVECNTRREPTTPPVRIDKVPHRHPAPKPIKPIKIPESPHFPTKPAEPLELPK